MEDNKLPLEDYRAIWREFYCAAFNAATTRSRAWSPIKDDDPIKIREYVEAAAKAADCSLEIYLQRRNMLREYNLKSFR